MSYNLAVWEGIRPVDDATATTTFEDRYRMHMRHVGGQKTSPTLVIRQYVEELVTRWPDMSPDDDEEAEDACPWCDGPLINNAGGPLFYSAWSSASIRRPRRLRLISPELSVSSASTPRTAVCSPDRHRYGHGRVHRCWAAVPCVRVAQAVQV
ncbi:hypothetical protein [Streptomyces sp. NPDC093111]|uniref:hypothetical protein n=1 Tax=Streptomyces sp. NPDC093111 TaxID=3154978 RepID=UPI003448BADA